MNANSKRLLVAAAIASAAAVFACVLFFFDPMTSAFYPRCPSKLLTGYDCPGCGTTRALHALVHLDFGAALRYNAALFVLGPLLLLYAADGKYYVGFGANIGARAASGGRLVLKQSDIKPT